MTKILYVGNQLKGKGQSVTTIDTLSTLLKSEGCTMILTSSRQNKFLRLLDMVFTFFKNKKQIDFILIDTYSTANFYYAYIIAFLSKCYKVRYIPILHGGNLPNRLDSSPKMSQQIFKNAFKNVAPSNYLKDAFEIKGFSVTFIPNVLEINKYHFKKRIDLQPKLLWVRSFATIYNPTLAIKILNKVKEKYPKAKLCMVGADKGEIQNCINLVKQLKLSDSVEFTGLLTPTQWHKKSEEFDIFINTTNFDNTPVSVMEAMALGLPIISTNVGGLPFLIENGMDGILIKPNNVSLFVTEICNFIEKPKLGMKLAINARHKVSQFDWGVIKKQWFKILEDDK